MQVCLLVNDDLQKTFKRFNRIKKGSFPGDFIPGESLQNTPLTPTHIYSKKEEKPVNTSNPAPQQPKKVEEVSDLFDLVPPESS